MDFTRRIELDVTYHDTIARVKDALKEQGFGVPGNPALAPIAAEAGQRIQAALDIVGSA